MRKGKEESKKVQKMTKWMDKGERGCPGPTRGKLWMEIILVASLFHIQ